MFFISRRILLGMFDEFMKDLLSKNNEKSNVIYFDTQSMNKVIHYSDIADIAKTVHFLLGKCLHTSHLSKLQSFLKHPDFS